MSRIRRIDRLARAAGKRGVRATTVLTMGYAADQIVRTAKARKAHLIVIGTHGRTGLSRLVPSGTLKLSPLKTSLFPRRTPRSSTTSASPARATSASA